MALWHAKEGKRLIPLAAGSKKPPRNAEGRGGWGHPDFDPDDPESWEGNLGWRLGKRDLIVDVDPRNGGDESWRRLKADLGLKARPTVLTPNGRHYYYSKPPKERYPKYLQGLGYPGIELLSEGSYAVVPPSRTPKGSYRWAEGGPRQPMRPKGLAGLAEMPGAGGLAPSAPEGRIASRQEIDRALARLDPNCNNAEWVKVGMALHDWSPEEGLGVWEEWSSRATREDADGRPLFKRGEAATRWRSFGGARKRVRLETLFWMAREGGDHITALKAAASPGSVEEALEALAQDAGVGAIARERIVKLAQGRLRELGETVGVAALRKAAKPAKAAPEPEGGGGGLGWLDSWCHTSHPRTPFYNLDERKAFTNARFDIRAAPHQREGADEAHRWVVRRGLVRDVDGVMYDPLHASSPIIRMGRMAFANTFDPRSIPDASQVEPDGRRARMFLRHLRILTGSRRLARILAYYIAHLVQHPGRKMPWCPVIIGPHNLGKTWVGVMIGLMLGHENVNKVTHSVIQDKYTDWAANCLVNLFEELKVSGHNRHEIVNKIKPYITDGRINIRPMYQSSYTVQNFTNYVAFSNHKDCIPIDGDRRRWCIMFCPYASVEEMGAAMGEEPSDYFRRVFPACEEAALGIKAWFEGVRIPGWFKRLTDAPRTHYVDMMIDTENEGVPGLPEALEAIKSGKCLFKGDVVFSRLQSALARSDAGVGREGVIRVLRKLGYVRVGRDTIKGRQESLWGRH